MIKNVRIEISPFAETSKIKSDEKYDYLKSELGMNMIIPMGKIEELRFSVDFNTDGDKDPVIAIDGFPKDVIEEKHILDGSVGLAVSNLFKFIPIVGGIAGEIVDVELEPWKFKLGDLKKVNVDFSGGLTDKPEWYFKKNGIKNELRVALTIKKPKDLKNVEADVKASWIYDPGIFKKEKIGTDAVTIKIFSE